MNSISKLRRPASLTPEGDTWARRRAQGVARHYRSMRWLRRQEDSWFVEAVGQEVEGLREYLEDSANTPQQAIEAFRWLRSHRACGPGRAKAAFEPLDRRLRPREEGVANLGTKGQIALMRALRERGLWDLAYVLGRAVLTVEDTLRARAWEPRVPRVVDMWVRPYVGLVVVLRP